MLKGVIVDDSSAELNGFTIQSQSTPPFVDGGYRHDGKSGDGLHVARFTPDLPEPGKYEIRMTYPAQANRATRVPVVVELGGVRSEPVLIDQTKPGPIDGSWHSLGVFDLKAGKNCSVEISNDGAEGYVVVDAVQFLPVK